MQSVDANGMEWCDHGHSGYLYRGTLYADEKSMTADEDRPYYAISVAFSFPVVGRQGRIAMSSWLL